MLSELEVIVELRLWTAHLSSTVLIALILKLLSYHYCANWAYYVCYYLSALIASELVYINTSVAGMCLEK